MALIPRQLLCFLLPVLITGCATAPKTFLTHATAPTDAFITQRGVLTVLGRQFTLNGYVALNATGGKRLVVTENFGNVLADVLVKPDGSVQVMKSSRAFRPEWIRNYLAADLECLFGDGPRENCPGQQLSPTHFLIKRRWYTLDLQTVETKPGPQPSALFEPAKEEKP